MTMRERMAAGLVSAAVLLGGAVAVTAIEPENVVLAQKKTAKAKVTVDSLKKEMAADNLKKIEKYIKDNPKADDIGAAYLLAIESSVKSSNLKSLKLHGENASKTMKEHSDIGAIMAEWGKAMLWMAPSKDGKTALETALKFVDDQAKLELYRALASVCGIDGDAEGAGKAYDQIEELPFIKGNQRNADYIKQEREKNTAGIGKAFDHFEETGFDDKPLKSADYKGKVVFIDFWATWCGPCVEEMPNVIAQYNKHKDNGFDVIGISLDDETQDGANRMREYIAKNKMPWRQFYDGKKWQNKLAQKYQVKGIPHTILLDKEGKVLATGLRGDALASALDRLLGSAE